MTKAKWQDLFAGISLLMLLSYQAISAYIGYHFVIRRDISLAQSPWPLVIRLSLLVMMPIYLSMIVWALTDWISANRKAIPWQEAVWLVILLILPWLYYYCKMRPRRRAQSAFTNLQG